MSSLKTQFTQRTRARFRAAVVVLGIVLGMMTGTAGTASAGTTTLCSGNSFATCTNAGYTAHGYENHFMASYWNAYSGHNCTNYVGYMLAQNGDAGHGVAMGVAGDWDDTIAAHPSWHYAMNGMAAVGAIAQWEANVGPATSSGHVGYVEAFDATSITVSWDNFDAGPFSWKKITTGSSDWPSRFLHIKDIEVAPSTTPARVGVLQTNGHFLVKEGGLGASWSDQLDNVASGGLASNRVGVLQTNGHFLVKTGGLGASWTDVLDNVASGTLSGNRIGVLQTNGHFLVKEGSVNSNWSDQKDNVASGVVLDDRIGVLQTNGHFLVKEGGLGQPWTDVLDNVQAIYMSGNRIAALQTNGHFLVKEGGLGSGWSDQIDNVSSGALSGNRIGVLQTNGHFLVKEGGLGASWSDQKDSVVSGTLAGNRIGVLQTNGHFLVKEGGLGSGWSDQIDNVSAGVLSSS